MGIVREKAEGKRRDGDSERDRREGDIERKQAGESRDRKDRENVEQKLQDPGRAMECVILHTHTNSL